MNDWKSQLTEKQVLLADGAWGTELARHGLSAGVAPESWNLENPDAVRRVAAAYVKAGADIVLTNTFGGSPAKLDKAGLRDQTAEINRIGAALSREAVAGKALVFASVGPTGEMLEPLGTATESDMTAWFAEQIAALAEGGADALVVETMSDLNEILCALRAARDVCALPVATTMTFSKGPRGYATMMGVRPEKAAAALADAGADIVGANCGGGIEDAVELARLMRPATDAPLWLKPNAGLPQLVGGKTVFKETPDDMAARIPALVEAGARIVGGCCGTGPDHIRRFAEELRTIGGG